LEKVRFIEILRKEFSESTGKASSLGHNYSKRVGARLLRAEQELSLLE
jgi:hypothetical protein